MIKNRVLFSYKKVFIWLSVLLFVAIIFILRGSSWPLFIDNRFTRFFLYNDSESDNTMYNIAISYLAAYIFYIIQIFFPESQKTKTAIIQTHLDMINCLRQCKIFIDGWKAYTVRDNKSGTIIGVDKKLIYYEDYQGNIVQITPRRLEETAIRILEEYDNIKNNFLFLQSDIELQKLFLEMDFAEQAHDWLMVLAGADIISNIPDSTIMESFSLDDLNEFEDRIQKLANLYGINKYIQLSKTNDKEKIMNYHKIIKESLEMIEKNEMFFKNLPDGYNQPIRKK